jgi:glycolate oxidase iron-sulfur subunit
MKQVLEGKLPLQQATQHIDQCLGCLACETNCPSQVKYGELISPFRATQESQRKRTMIDRLKRFLVSQTLPYPLRFRWAMRTGRLASPFKRLLPATLRPMLDLVPKSLPRAIKLQPLYSPAGTPRGRVALLAGCAQQVIAPEINQATINVLLKNQIEVVVPVQQVCCGALAWHVGDQKTARRLATRNLQAFPADIDCMVTNAAGCGSGIHDYKIMFRGTPLEQQATELADKAMDVSKYLQRIGLTPPTSNQQKKRVAYHDACHLAHAQQVRHEPRALLQSIKNLELIEINDGETCCGSAGTYNIDQPEIAAKLGRLKAERIAETDCDIVVMGNIGCMVQIQQHLAAMDSSIQVMHTMQLLDQAYGK